MILETEFRLGNLVNYGGEIGVIAELKTHGNNKIGVRTLDFDSYVSFGKEITPIPITIHSLGSCNPQQMNRVSALLDICMNEHNESAKEFSILVKHTGRQIRSVHELQNFYRENTGEELVYSEP